MTMDYEQPVTTTTADEALESPDRLMLPPVAGETSLEPAVEAVEESAPKHSVWPLVYEVLETILLAAIIWLAVNFATARFVVEGSSMEPNFHTGQMLIVSRLHYKLGSPQRGDVIVFIFPRNQIDDYIKRVIGIPGDTVEIANGVVKVNGRELREPYIKFKGAAPDGRWLVPPDHYFVLGDNRPQSSDSPDWGLLSKDLIIGRALVAYWPPKYWGIIPQVSYDVPNP